MTFVDPLLLVPSEDEDEDAHSPRKSTVLTSPTKSQPLLITPSKSREMSGTPEKKSPREQ
jgi:hypothetical protein